MELNSRIASKDSDLDMLHHSSIHISSVCMPLLKNSPVRSFGRVCDSLCPLTIWTYMNLYQSLSRRKIVGHWQYGGVGFYGPLKETASCIREVLLGMHAGRVLSSTFVTRVLPRIMFFWNSDDWLIKTRWWISYIKLWFKGCKLFYSMREVRFRSQFTCVFCCQNQHGI